MELRSKNRRLGITRSRRAQQRLNGHGGPGSSVFCGCEAGKSRVRRALVRNPMLTGTAAVALLERLQI